MYISDMNLFGLNQRHPEYSWSLYGLNAEFDGGAGQHAIGRSSSDDVIGSRAVPRGRVGRQCVVWVRRPVPVYRGEGA